MIKRRKKGQGFALLNNGQKAKTGDKILYSRPKKKIRQRRIEEKPQRKNERKREFLMMDIPTIVFYIDVGY